MSLQRQQKLQLTLMFIVLLLQHQLLLLLLVPLLALVPVKESKVTSICIAPYYEETHV